MVNSTPRLREANVGDLPSCGFTYIMTNHVNEILYVGVTNDIVKRSTEHRLKIIRGFTSKYNLDKLVYYEEYASIAEAMKRERQLKKYPRQFKINLIEIYIIHINPCAGTYK